MLHVDEDRLRWSAPSRAQLDRFAAVVARHALTLIAPGDQVPFGEMCETVARDGRAKALYERLHTIREKHTSRR